MEQPVSRRRVLALAGGGLAGAAALARGGEPAAADAPGLPRLVEERGYRVLPLPGSGRARIQRAGSGSAGPIAIEAALKQPAFDAVDELVVFVRAVVPEDRVGRRRVLRTGMIGDNGDLRMETVGPDVRIDNPAFELQIALGRGHPIRDWNLLPERIFALRVTLNILDTSDFAVSDDLLFKVRRG